MIRHTVFFRLTHPAGSAAEADFLDAARGLAAIPGVQTFARLRQVGAKNPFTLGLSMDFADEAARRAGYLDWLRARLGALPTVVEEAKRARALAL